VQVDTFSSGVLLKLAKDCGLPAASMSNTDNAEWHVASACRIVTKDEDVVSSGKLVLAYTTTWFDTRKFYIPNTNRREDRGAYVTLLCKNY